ncbi:MAG: FHA domain-containing protein [SAR324 cluster bacterium]|nr:FHA domain-containing protein [SAR324 cluster bacterium]
MIHIAAFTKNFWFLRWGFGIFVSIGILCSPVNAGDWNIKINATDSYLAYLGGEYFIYLDITDENGKHVGNLSNENISFKINKEPYLHSDFYYQYQRLEQRIALLSGVEKAIDPQDLESVKRGFHQFILNKKDSDEIYINFNGSGQDGSVLNFRDELEDILKSVNPDPENSKPVADFLLKEMQTIRSSGKRQWVILLVPDSDAEIDETKRQVLVDLLVNHHITLIPVVIGKPVSDHWLKLLAMQARGRVHQINSYEQLPDLLKQIGDKIRQEYALSYRLNSLGFVPHNVEIKFMSQDGLKAIRHRARPIPIWPSSPDYFPLVGITLIGGIVIAMWGFVLLRRLRSSASFKQKGFQIMTPGENFQFIPLKEESYSLDFLSSIKTKGNLRLSANLGKVVLSEDQNSYFLEDKNYKNALLINRRRVRRTLLRHGDILDIGEMTLIYLNHVKSHSVEEKKPEHSAIPIYFDKPQGPIRKKIGMLIDETSRQEYHLVKNITFIGRSKTNNVVLDSPHIALKQAKIVRIGVQYKLHSLNTQEGSFVNRRRVEQRFLKDGDEISFDTCRLRFRIVHNPQSRTEKTRGERMHHG